ncbi:MAG: alpha/beta hydrolase [Muribaculaceae bacterium]|nr:alpha/beta hydrolase [Muribaculaceae bacterium]
MIKRLFLSIFLSAMAIVAFADNFTLSPAEQKKITEEAEDWIDDMPDGLQDRLSDAVNHALHGFYSEINYFRNMADTTGISAFPVKVSEITAGNGADIPIRIYSPENKKTSSSLPLLIYFHGGGWAMGSISGVDKFCRALAAKGNVIVASVDYPLAPEHPFPAASLKAVEAIEYLAKNSIKWNADANNLSLGGDGAGGNIALTAFNSLPSSIKVHSLVLYYPLIQTKGQLDPASKRQYGRGYGFDSRLWETFSQAYNAPFSDYKRPLPPTLLISAGRDIIISQEKEFAGINNVRYIEFSGAIHGFITDGQQKTAFKKAVELTDYFILNN